MKRTRILFAAMMMGAWSVQGLGPVAADSLAAATSTTEEAPAALGATAAIEWNVTYASRYAFQGLDYSANRPVFQPYAAISVASFTLSGWGNVDQTRGILDEVDLGIARAWAFGPWSGSAGYLHLRFPHRDGWLPTHEATFDLALDAPLSPALSLHWDVDAGTGRYWTLGGSHEVGFDSGTLQLSTRIHAQDHYYGMTGVPAIETGASFGRAIGSMSVQVSLARQWTFANGDFRDDFAVAPGWVAALNVASR